MLFNNWYFGSCSIILSRKRHQWEKQREGESWPEATLDVAHYIRVIKFLHFSSILFQCILRTEMTPTFLLHTPMYIWHTSLTEMCLPKVMSQRILAACEVALVSLYTQFSSNRKTSIRNYCLRYKKFCLEFGPFSLWKGKALFKLMLGNREIV